MYYSETAKGDASDKRNGSGVLDMKMLEEMIDEIQRRVDWPEITLNYWYSNLFLLFSRWNTNDQQVWLQDCILWNDSLILHRSILQMDIGSNEMSSESVCLSLRLVRSDSSYCLLACIPGQRMKLSSESMYSLQNPIQSFGLNVNSLKCWHISNH